MITIEHELCEDGIYRWVVRCDGEWIGESHKRALAEAIVRAHLEGSK